MKKNNTNIKEIMSVCVKFMTDSHEELQTKIADCDLDEACKKLKIKNKWNKHSEFTPAIGVELYIEYIKKQIENL